MSSVNYSTRPKLVQSFQQLKGVKKLNLPLSTSVSGWRVPSSPAMPPPGGGAWRVWSDRGSVLQELTVSMSCSFEGAEDDDGSRSWCGWQLTATHCRGSYPRLNCIKKREERRRSWFSQPAEGMEAIMRLEKEKKKGLKREKKQIGDWR